MDGRPQDIVCWAHADRVIARGGNVRALPGEQVRPDRGCIVAQCEGRGLYAIEHWPAVLYTRPTKKKRRRRGRKTGQVVVCFAHADKLRKAGGVVNQRSAALARCCVPQCKEAGFFDVERWPADLSLSGGPETAISAPQPESEARATPVCDVVQGDSDGQTETEADCALVDDAPAPVDHPGVCGGQPVPEEAAPPADAAEAVTGEHPFQPAPDSVLWWLTPVSAVYIPPSGRRWEGGA